MSSLFKAKYVDRDDFDPDHYADCIRDLHRSRLTVDQLDIAQRQLRKKEKLLSRIQYLRMKEHARVKNDFVRKVKQDTRISNLPSVKETLKVKKIQQSTSSHSPIPHESSPEMAPDLEVAEKLRQLKKLSRLLPKPDSPRTSRLKANMNKFNGLNSLIG